MDYSINDARRAAGMPEYLDNVFVPKYYEMDPNTEDLLFDGTFLRDGMVVLVGEARFRADLTADMTPEAAEIAKRFNRWAQISNLTFDNRWVVFLARYDDGTKRKVIVEVQWPWLVKLNSISTPTADNYGIAYVPPQESETRVFRFGANEPNWAETEEAKRRLRDNETLGDLTEIRNSHP